MEPDQEETIEMLLKVEHYYDKLTSWEVDYLEKIVDSDVLEEHEVKKLKEIWDRVTFENR